MLLRGLLEDVQLFEWLSTMWRLKRNFDAETLYWANLMGLVEMARSGITCFNEHFDAYHVEPQIEALKKIPVACDTRLWLRRPWTVRADHRLVLECA